MNSTEIKILFEPFENVNSFINHDEKRIEKLNVTYYRNNNSETICLVKFNDIGLDSKFGEIEIKNKNGFWEFLKDSSQLNKIKNKIVEQLMLHNI